MTVVRKLALFISGVMLMLFCGTLYVTYRGELRERRRLQDGDLKNALAILASFCSGPEEPATDQRCEEGMGFFTAMAEPSALKRVVLLDGNLAVRVHGDFLKGDRGARGALSREPHVQTAAAAGVVMVQRGVASGGGPLRVYSGPVNLPPSVRGLLLAEFRERDLEAALAPLRRDAGRRLLQACLFGLAASLFLALEISLYLLSPLDAIVAASRRVAGGDFGVRVPEGRRDELGRLSTEFNAMTARLGELDALKDSFLSKATHDLRNPLNGMLGLIELVLGGYKGPVGPQARESLEGARQSGQALAGIIDNMLDITRLEAGRMAIDPQALDLRVELSSAVEAARREAEAAGVSVDLVEPAEPLQVRADAGALGKVLAALLSNAVKFTPSGGQARVSARRGRPREVTVSVADTGVGVPAEHLGRLFAPFFQVPETKNKARPTTGAGLGLALAKGLVEAQGGRLWVESDGRRGAKFSFTLREEPSSPAGAPAAPPA